MTILPDDYSDTSEAKETASRQHVARTMFLPGDYGPRSLEEVVPRPPSSLIYPDNQDEHDADRVSMRPAEEIAPKERNVKPLSVNAMMIRRRQLAKGILEELSTIQPLCGTPSMIGPATRLIDSMRVLIERSEEDPYKHIVSALHDAIAYKQRCLDYSAEQYEHARCLLQSMLDRERIDSSAWGRALGNIEGIGFDTVPFEFDFDTEDEFAESE